MKITRILFNNKDAYGIHNEQKEINNLSNFIVLAGANGSGKTRLLNYLEAQTKKYFSSEQNRANSDLFLSGPVGPIFNITQEKLFEITNTFKNNSLNAVLRGRKFTALNREEDIQKNLIQPDPLQFFSSDTFLLFLKSGETLMQEEVKELRKAPRRNEDTLQRIAQLRSQRLFTKLQKTIALFLDREILITEENNEFSLWMNDEKVVFNQLSPGQQRLLAFATFFATCSIEALEEIRNSIILIDEPELNLHPSVQTTLINKIKELIGQDGQLIIATHSIHILSMFSYDEIFLTENGQIFPPNRLIPSKAYEKLVGTIEERKQFEEFVDSTIDWAYSNFIVETLFEPTVVIESSNSDPQWKSIVQLLKKGNLKILDYGCGHCRIGKLIQQEFKMNDIPSNYFGFDISKVLNDEFVERLDDKQQLYYSEHEIPNETFDLVILSNTLHEIDPRFWRSIAESIFRVLKPNGTLLFLEDKYISHGERLEGFGYIVLDVKEIMFLFSTRTTTPLISTDPNLVDRLVSLTISKKHMMAIKGFNISQLLDICEKRLFEESMHFNDILNKGKGNTVVARRYGCSSKMYFNVRMMQRMITQENSRLLM